MTPEALSLLQARISRLVAAVERKAATGFVQHHLIDGRECTFAVSGAKSPEQLEDELLTLFVWLWSLKDYLKQAYAARGLEPRLVEEVVNNSPPLQYVSDIANGAKHAVLRESRSGRFATLVDVGITVPQAAIARLVYRPDSIDVEVAKPQEVVLVAAVRLRPSEDIDAFKVLQDAIATWEQHALPPLAA